MTKRVLLLLAEGFEPLEAAGFTDVLGWANIDGEQPIEVVTAGLRSPLRPTFGCPVIPAAMLADIDPAEFDALAIPGGFEGAGFYDDAMSAEFLAVARAFDARSTPIASVCVGSLAIGAAGLLRGRHATTYHQLGGKRKAQLEAFGATFVDAPVVIDGGFVTSTGPGTALEVAFALLEMLTSRANAMRIRQLMRVPVPDPAWLLEPQVPAVVANKDEALL